MRQFIYGFVAGALLLLSGTAAAQYRDRDRSGPLEDFLRGMENRQGNSNLNCNIQHRLDRQGDIRSIRIDCDRGGLRGR